MKFIEAYKKILEGTRVTKEGLNVTGQQGPSVIRYLGLVTPSYIEREEVVGKEAPFIAAFDLKGAMHRLSESNAIAMMVSEDDDWSSWEDRKEDVKEEYVVEEKSAE